MSFQSCPIKLIVNNGLEDLWRRENTDSSVSARYNRSPGTRFRICRVYADLKISNNTKINHIMGSIAGHNNAISVKTIPSKTKIGKESQYYNNYPLLKPEFSSTTSNLLFYLKDQKRPLFSKWMVRLHQVFFKNEY